MRMPPIPLHPLRCASGIFDCAMGRNTAAMGAPSGRLL